MSNYMLARLRSALVMRRTFAAAIALTSTLVIAACSSSGSGSGGGATSSSSASGSSSSGVAAAKAYVQPFLTAPTSIGISTPLKTKPPAGKLIVGLDLGNVGNGKVLAGYWAQAAADAGWKYKDLVTSTTPSAIQAAFNSAVQLNPAGIVITGIPKAALGPGLALATQKGIWVNTSGTTDQPSGALYNTSIASTSGTVQYGKEVAAYVVAQSDGKAVIQDFSLPEFPIVHVFDTAFEAAVKQWCPSCKVTEHPQLSTDIGTKTPQAVVSAVTRDPSTNWLIFDIGDLATGVNAALSAAGLHGLHIGGNAADLPQIQALKDKTQDVWIGYTLPIAAYRQVDSLIRKFEGTPILNANLPSQLITQDSVGSIAADSTGHYVGVADFRDQFKKLWLLTASAGG